MIMKCVCIRDSALNAFTRPFFVPAIGAAVRAFTDEINNSQSDLFKHPSDYILFELGSWDDSTSLFDLHDNPRQITRGSDVFIKP